MPNTTVNALPYPAYGTGADGPAAFQALAEAVAPKLHRAEPLTTAQIAAVASPRIGQLVFNTDVGKTQEWNGSTWRGIGAGATGTFTFPVLTLSTTYQTVSFFVGLGFTEVNFAMGTGPGAGGIYVTAVSNAAQLRGIATNGSQSNLIKPTAATDVYFAGVAANSQSTVRNIRLEADGFLRMELGSSGPALTTSSADRINWGAR